MKPGCRIGLLSACAVTLVTVSSAAQDCAPLRANWPGEQRSNAINLVSSGQSWVNGAASAWNTTCDVEQIPNLQVSSSPQGGMLNVNVVYHAGNNPGGSSGGGCGHTNLVFQGGLMVSGTVNVWERDSAGADCDDREWVMEHELGHLFGLDDEYLSACEGSLMYGFYSPGGGVTESICAKADSQWFTDWESSDPCDYPNPPQGCDNGQDPNPSPIVIDLEGNGFHFTGADDVVRFDIDADGAREAISWTSASTLDAFLALDRNWNGRIDDGSELFGNYTPLSDGSLAPNGYEAVLELDHRSMGGNGDGVIDPLDTAYFDLLLWVDWNHDGVSEPSELVTAADGGITRLKLDYKESRRRDGKGNLLTFTSPVWVQRDGRERRVWSVDVFFIEVAP